MRRTERHGGVPELLERGSRRPRRKGAVHPGQLRPWRAPSRASRRLRLGPCPGAEYQAWVFAGLLMLRCSPAVSNPPAATVGAAGATVALLPAGVRVKQLALGDHHTCGLLESGRVACWGDNGMGQLGNGSDELSAVPLLVPHVLDAVDIRANRATTCVRTKNGVVACWGDNAYGQGNPQFDVTLTSAPTPWGVYDSGGEPPKFTPANVSSGSRRRTTPPQEYESLSLGQGHGCGAYQAGSVRCWGDASHGQLGVAALRDAFEVQTIAGLPALVEVASAQFYSCGRTAEGDVWCWGANEQAQLGSLAPGPSPRQVPGVAGATSLQLAANRACARLGGGQVICWGDSLDCGEDHQQGPAVAPDLENDVQFVRAAGECFWCILDSGHGLKCDGDPIAEVSVCPDERRYRRRRGHARLRHAVRRQRLVLG